MRVLTKISRWTTVMAMAAVATVTGVTGSAQPAAAATIFVEYTKTSVGPRGPITVVGDSVALGSVLEVEGYGPSVAQMLVDRGWGPVLAKAGVGSQAGLLLPPNHGANMKDWVTQRRAAGWDSPVWAVMLGPNDIIGCNGDVACAEQDILSLVDTIGPEYQIWWSLITANVPANEVAFNQALRNVAAQRPNLYLWDWPTIRVQNNIPIAADNTHLPTGADYVRKSTLMADDLTARFGASIDVGDPEAPPSALGPSTEYSPVAPERVFDSRDLPARVQAGSETIIDMSEHVPESTSAVSINLTAVTPNAAGFLTAYPCGGQRPLTSNVNYLAGEIRPNHVVVGLGSNGTLCVFSSAMGDVIVDLQGAFVPSEASRLTPFEPPARLVDTRDTGRQDPLVVPIGDVDAAVLNITAVNAVAPGFVVAYPCDGEMPDTSNLNFVAAAAVAGSAYVGVAQSGPNEGTVCIHANVPVDIVVDLQGTFAGDGELAFQAATPKRMLDTRLATGGWRGQAGINQVLEVGVAPAEAKAVTGNITLVQPSVDGYATAYGCENAPPGTSSVNASGRAIAANSMTTGADGALCIRSFITSHLIFDITGWWTS